MKKSTKLIFPLVIGVIIYVFSDNSAPEEIDQDSVNESKEILIRLPKSKIVAQKKIEKKDTKERLKGSIAEPKVDSKKSSLSTLEPREIGEGGSASNEITSSTPDPLWMRDTFYRDNSTGKKMLLTEEEIKRDFPTGLPKEINITKKGKTYRLIHPNRNGTGEGQGKTFYAVDEETIEQKVAELNATDGSSGSGPSSSLGGSRTFKSSGVSSNSSSSSNTSSTSSNGNNNQQTDYVQISEYNASFIPGYKDYEQTKQIRHPGNIYERIVKADFKLSDEIPGGRKVEIDPWNMSKSQKEALEQISRSLLSLGHGGTLSLDLYDYDGLSGGSNDRIVVYENPFKIQDKSMREKYGDYFFELAYVEVGNNTGKRHRFPCNLKSPYAKGSYCAGTIPTHEGGNKFFLKHVKSKKLKEVTLVNVIDTGKNILPAAINREDAVGADIDSVILQKED